MSPHLTLVMYFSLNQHHLSSSTSEPFNFLMLLCFIPASLFIGTLVCRSYCCYTEIAINHSEKSTVANSEIFKPSGRAFRRVSPLFSVFLCWIINNSYRKVSAELYVIELGASEFLQFFFIASIRVYYLSSIFSESITRDIFNAYNIFKIHLRPSQFYEI